MRLLKQLGVVAAIAFVGSQSVAATADNPWLALLLGFATAALALLGYAWVVRRTERRAPVEVARQGAGAAISRGALIGLGMFVVVIAIIALLGGYRVNGWGSATGAIALFGVTAAAAVTEELIFRGILFRILEERAGTWGGLALTGALFGLSHLFNPNASLGGAIAIAVEAGLMLGAAYVATRSLWVPIGLHFGWNFAEGGIFGTGVSGNGASKGLLHGVTSGSSLLTGGEFGPEASLYTVLAGVIVAAAFMALARRRGHIVPRRSRRSVPASTVPASVEQAGSVSASTEPAKTLPAKTLPAKTLPAKTLPASAVLVLDR